MKLVILDRDGVINHESTEFIKSADEWQPIKGSLEAIAQLSQAGVHVVVITNQSGVGRGLLSSDMLGQIHVRMIDQVRQCGGKIQCILYCPHLPDADCDCRKPKTGMYDDLAARLNVSFAGTYSVGDSLRDLIAARDAGATPVLVKTGNGRTTLQNLEAGEHQFDSLLVYKDLADFVDAYLHDRIPH